MYRNRLYAAGGGPLTSWHKLSGVEHRRHGVDLYNQAYQLLEDKQRSAEDALRMLQMAEDSLRHFLACGTPVNEVRGRWMLARVHAELGHVAESGREARHALDVCMREEIGDIDLAWAYEGRARAALLAGERASAGAWIGKARAMLPTIAEETDVAMLQRSLDALAASAA